MDANQEARTRAISAWLDDKGKKREWLADQLGVSVTTVNGWFSKASGRPIPVPTDRLIDRIMQDEQLGEPRFSIPESNQILKAMESAGYVSFQDFARDAVKDSAEKILSSEPISQLAEVAEDFSKYPETSSNT